MSDSTQLVKFSIYRYQGGEPFMQSYEVDIAKHGCVMVLDALLAIKDHHDETLSLRRSCREGVCGSDGMNINGKNGLACTTPIEGLSQPIVIRPLPGLPVVKDLIVDMKKFYRQYENVEPWLQKDDEDAPLPAREHLQSPEQRAKLDGLYECILCGCCSTSCPSYWWNPDKFAGPAALLQAARFLEDSRDTATEKRLDNMSDPYTVFRCRGIMNCVDACPKGLNPTKAIATVRGKMISDET